MNKLLYALVIGLIFFSSMILVSSEVKAESCPRNTENLTDEDMLNMPNCIRGHPEVGQKLCNRACGDIRGVGSYEAFDFTVSSSGSIEGYCINGNIDDCIEGCDNTETRNNGEVWCYKNSGAIEVGSPSYSFEIKCIHRIE
jgi:hypothetical protein